MLYRALKWILVLIVAFMAAALAEGLIDTVFDAFDGVQGHAALSVWQQMVKAFGSGLAFTLVPALIPFRLRYVAPVVFTIGVLVGVLPTVYLLMSHEYLRERASQDVGKLALPIAADVVGGAVAVLIARWKDSRPSSRP